MDEQMNREKDRWIDIKVDEWMVRTFMDQQGRKLYFQNTLAQLNFTEIQPFFLFFYFYLQFHFL